VLTALFACLCWLFVLQLLIAKFGRGEQGVCVCHAPHNGAME
jgi:hypothetical protein